MHTVIINACYDEDALFSITCQNLAASKYGSVDADTYDEINLTQIKDALQTVAEYFDNFIDDFIEDFEEDYDINEERHRFLILVEQELLQNRDRTMLAISEWSEQYDKNLGVLI